MLQVARLLADDAGDVPGVPPTASFLHSTRLAAGVSALVPAVVAVVTLVLVAAAVVATFQWRGAGAVLGVLCGPVVLVAWQLLTGRAPKTHETPGIRPVGDLGWALGEMVAEEAEAWGLVASGSIRLTATRDVAVVNGTLSIGLFALAEQGPSQVRVAIAEAILRDADAEASALRARREGFMTRALATAEAHPRSAAPWAWYARRARWLTDAALRRRGLALDRQLAAHYGQAATATNVRTIARAESFADYWLAFAVPTLNAGYHLPLVDGWKRWLASPSEADDLAESLHALDAAGPWADAPSLSERLAVVAAAGRGVTPPAKELAALPDDGLTGAEAALLTELEAERAAHLIPLAWEQLGEAVVVPQARARVLAAAGDLGTVADLPELCSEGSAEDPVPLDLLGDALLVALADDGWQIVVTPDGAWQAVSEQGTVWPYGVPYALADAEGDEDESEAWRLFAEENLIADLPLTPLAPADVVGAQDLEALMAAPAAVPSSARVELRLAVPPGRAVRAALVVAAGVVLGLPMSALLIYEAFAVEDIPDGGRVFFMVCGLALGAGLALWSRSRVRLIRGAGRLILDGEGLRIEHPALLRHPFELPRALLRNAVLDSHGEQRDDIGRPATLPIAEIPWLAAPQAGWLWTADEGSIVPILGVQPCVPNLAIVFTHPLAGPDVRRERTDGPLRGEAVAGLLLAVKADSATTATLRRLGFEPELSLDDARVLYSAFREEVVAPTA